MRWGRATLQLVCANCRRIIEDGDRILFLRIGEGCLCARCGESCTAAAKKEAA